MGKTCRSKDFQKLCHLEHPNIYFCFPGGGFASFNNFQQHQESQQASSAEQGPLASTNNNNNGNVTKADNNVGEGPFQNAFSTGREKIL